MGSMKAQFPRLTNHLPPSSNVRRLILFICIRLFNLRARTETRGNMISNVYDHEWVRSFSRPSSEEFHRLFANFLFIDKP
jgi:hypothetical protein